MTRNGSQSQFFLWAGILAPELIKNSVETVVKLISLSRTSLMKLCPNYRQYSGTTELLLKWGGGGGG